MFMTMSRKAYPGHFYRSLVNSDVAAAHVVSAILHDVKPASVVDVGCGIGSFLAAFIKTGVPDVCGIDLPPSDEALLQIPLDLFVPHDLTLPIEKSRKYGLALSLEVAEHMPLVHANTLVQSLTSLSDIVVFSAAIPRQGGWEHINEQWQDWWARKFADHGYVAIDSIRDRIWNDESIPFYYRQNILMFVREELLESNDSLAALHRRTQQASLARVHPAAYLEKAEPRRITLRFAFQSCPYLLGASIRAIRQRLYWYWPQRGTAFPSNLCGGKRLKE